MSSDLSLDGGVEHPCCCCIPWELSCAETGVHCIPGFGAITACVKACGTEPRVERIRASVIPIEMIPPVEGSTLTFERVEPLLQGPTAAQWSEYQLHERKKNNRLVMCFLNIAVSFLIIYAIALSIERPQNPH